MVEEMVINVFNKQIAAKYPHLKLPAILSAKVTKATKISNGNEYTLKILDKTGAIDEHFPEIPRVLSTLAVNVGSTVAIGLLYGELNPYIIGEMI